jgi:ribonuclease HII
MKQNPVFPSLTDLACPPDNFALERYLTGKGYCRVGGVDEAGRGPLAGPVVAACVVLPPDCDARMFQDSKQLTAHRRDVLFDALAVNGAVIGVGLASPEEIERINILRASLLAMQRAMEACTFKGGDCPDFLLVDGKFPVPAQVSQWTLIKGESKSGSIAAASIIAKVTRDRLMAEADRQFPEYGFIHHQGYPTKAHREAIRIHGPCPLHRRTFRGVREHLAVDAMSRPLNGGDAP